MSGQQIYLILTPLITYAASSTIQECVPRSDPQDDGETKIKVTASLGKHTTSKPKGAT